MDFTARMMDCDFDYDGFAGGPYQIFLRWNGIRYGTLEEAKQRAPVLKHAVLLDARTLFASRAMPPTDVARAHDTSIDLRLSSRSKAVDAGQALPGWNDGFRGLRPDLGAYELGDSPPHHGPRSARPECRYLFRCDAQVLIRAGRGESWDPRGHPTTFDLDVVVDEQPEGLAAVLLAHCIGVLVGSVGIPLAVARDLRADVCLPVAVVVFPALLQRHKAHPRHPTTKFGAAAAEFLEHGLEVRLPGLQSIWVGRMPFILKIEVCKCWVRSRRQEQRCHSNYGRVPSTLSNLSCRQSSRNRALDKKLTLPKRICRSVMEKQVVAICAKLRNQCSDIVIHIIRYVKIFSRIGHARGSPHRCR